MKFSVIISALSFVFFLTSCDMDGANNPANSAESSDSMNTGMEMSGAPANPATPGDMSETTTGNSLDTMSTQQQTVR